MSIFRIVKDNKLYTVLLVFILLVNVAAFITSHYQGQEKATSEKITEQKIQRDKDEPIKALPTKKEMDRQREKLRTLMEENPLLYVFISLFELLILFIIFFGFIFDGYFIVRWLKRKPPDIKLLDRPEALWTVGDVFRVIIIFLSGGYIFAILQGPFMDIIPILKNKNFSMVFNSGIINMGAIAVILFFVIKKYGQNIITLGLSLKKSVLAAFIGIAGYITALPIIFVIMVLTVLVVKLIGYEPPVQPIVEVFMEEKQKSVLGISILFAAISGPIAEEVFFRGFMYSAIRRRSGVLLSILITSSLFSALHTHPVGFLPIMVLGVLLAYLYEKTGSLIPSITVHILHNLSSVFMVFIAKYLNS